MHTRYPKFPYEGENSPLARSIRIIDDFFDKCAHPICVPLHGAELSAYGVGSTEQEATREQQ